MSETHGIIYTVFASCSLAVCANNIIETNYVISSITGITTFAFGIAAFRNASKENNKIRKHIAELSSKEIQKSPNDPREISNIIIRTVAISTQIQNIR